MSLAPTGLRAVFAALKKDLLGPDGPQISTMRGQQLAILVYPPKDEYLLRQQVQTLTHELADGGWNVQTLDLQRLLFQRLRDEDPRLLDRLIQRERMLAEDDRQQAQRWLGQKLAPFLEGPDGLAKDVIRELKSALEQAPDPTRLVVLLGRVGALYPFFRSSALLKYLDGHNQGVPVVLLYPGRRVSQYGLSFMDKVAPDGDYRPRIYSI